jgi:hypothetical protein
MLTHYVSVVVQNQPAYAGLDALHYHYMKVAHSQNNKIRGKVIIRGVGVLDQVIRLPVTQTGTVSHTLELLKATLGQIITDLVLKMDSKFAVQQEPLTVACAHTAVKVA